MVWDEETIHHLRDLWAQGLSTAEIGRRLNVSKNAIVGKAHRLDLDARPSPIRREFGETGDGAPTGLSEDGGTDPAATAKCGSAIGGLAGIQRSAVASGAGDRSAAGSSAISRGTGPAGGHAVRADPGSAFRPILLLADRRAGNEGVPVL